MNLSGNHFNPGKIGLPRRNFVFALATAATGLALGRSASADDHPTTSPDVDRAVTAGLNYLARQQGNDGSFDPAAGVAPTSRALLAFLSSGNVPEIGKHGLTARRAVEWLLAQQNSQGWYGPTDRGLRPHTTTATALAEAFGVETSSDRRITIHASLAKAVPVILNRQVAGKTSSQPGGGWESGPPNSAGESLPVTATSLLALRACADIGLAMPPAVVTRAVQFALRCYVPSPGGFAAAPGLPPDIRATAAAVVLFFAAETAEANADKVNAAARFLLARSNDPGATADAGGIVPLAATKLGHDVWLAAGQPMLSRLAKLQEKDGSWPSIAPPGGTPISRIAATASALSVLTMSYPLLPIYQR